MENSLEEILDKFSTEDIIDAIGEESLLETIGARRAVSFFSADELMDCMWDSDIEHYYKKFIQEEDCDSLEENDNNPMTHLLRFCQCYRNDYESRGFHSYQIRDWFKEFMENFPEKFHPII